MTKLKLGTILPTPEEDFIGCYATEFRCAGAHTFASKAESLSENCF